MPHILLFLRGITMKFENLLKNLPNDPGVYIMKDKTGKVIYVGKAKVLKNRVKQYFQDTNRHTPKVSAMVSRIDSFEYIITDSELEALILECNLIKKYKPYYNILLKDDKNYPYVKVTLNDDYPKILFSRRMQRDGAKYFGPYTSSSAVKEAIDLCCRIFKIPVCGINISKDMGKKRACINAQMGRCMAVCENVISKEEYRKIINDACDFLDGNVSKVLDSLTKKMEKASEDLEFERAASLRDEIRGVKQIENKQKIVSDKNADEDIIGLYSQNNKTFSEIFFVRRGRLIGRHNAVINNTGEMSESETASSFIKQFYQDADFVPKNIYIQFECDEKELLSDWLTQISGRTVKIHTPQKGEKKALVNMANKNAKQSALNYMLKNAEGRNGIKRLILDLKEELGLDSPPYRIESYDISHTGGENSVGSMVVFVNGEPKKKFYRRFKIQVATGGDDYASMTEVILRRLKRANEEEKLIETGELKREEAKFLPLPDCIFLDGGKGHLSAISEVLELTDNDIPLFAMVKDDKHKTNTLLRNDGSRVGIKPHSEEFRLVSQIQEEVHRFAIEYHRSLRGKKVKGSSLKTIDGVGEKTAQKLLKHFKSVGAIKKAEIDEIKAAGVSTKIAEKVYDHFKNKT